MFLLKATLFLTLSFKSDINSEGINDNRDWKKEKPWMEFCLHWPSENFFYFTSAGSLGKLCLKHNEERTLRMKNNRNLLISVEHVWKLAVPILLLFPLAWDKYQTYLSEDIRSHFLHFCFVEEEHGTGSQDACMQICSLLTWSLLTFNKVNVPLSEFYKPKTLTFSAVRGERYLFCFLMDICRIQRWLDMLKLYPKNI